LALDLNRDIIPIIIDDFDFDNNIARMTGKLKALSRFNGLRFRSEYFRESMVKLRKNFLKSPPVET
jgi:hypothetical protein